MKPFCTFEPLKQLQIKNANAMTAKEIKKLQKALELVKKAELLVDSVVKTSDSFKYDGNTTILLNRISGVISILSND